MCISHAGGSADPRGKIPACSRSAVSGQLSGALPQRRRVRRAVFEYRTEPEFCSLLLASEPGELIGCGSCFRRREDAERVLRKNGYRLGCGI